MIKSAEEFVRIRSSENLEEQRRAGVEEASLETWYEVINKYPDYKEWVIHNKTIPIEILDFLSKDPDPGVRWVVARKRKISAEIFDRLKNDKDENVKLSLYYNSKLTKEHKDQIDSSGSIWFQREIFKFRKAASHLNQEIKLFGYNEHWIKLGIVDESKIHEDLTEFKKGEDDDPDHFRHRRLTNWLLEKTQIDDNEFDILCKLHKSDIDVGYANSVIVSYFSLKLLDEHSTELLENKIEKLSPFLKSFISEKRLKRKIKKGITQKELHQLIIDKKNSILRQLAEHSDSQHILEILANYEGSKRIRNISKERIKGSS